MILDLVDHGHNRRVLHDAFDALLTVIGHADGSRFFLGVDFLQSLPLLLHFGARAADTDTEYIGMGR